MSQRQYSKFTIEDEQTLIDMVNEQLLDNKRIQWKPIAQAINKTPRQCYDFYIIRKQSDTKTMKHEWQEQEINQLMDAVQQFGTKWDQIKLQFFPSLTQNQLRNKYYHTSKSIRVASQQNLNNITPSRLGSAVEINNRALSLNDFFNLQFTDQNQSTTYFGTTQNEAMQDNLDIFGEAVNNIWEDEY